MFDNSSRLWQSFACLFFEIIIISFKKKECCVWGFSHKVCRNSSEFYCGVLPKVMNKYSLTCRYTVRTPVWRNILILMMNELMANSESTKMHCCCIRTTPILKFHTCSSTHTFFKIYFYKPLHCCQFCITLLFWQNYSYCCQMCSKLNWKCSW